MSLVLNKSETPSVPDATRARILKLAGEMQYQPHHPARMLRRARTMALACVVPDITNPFYPGLVRGVQSVATPAGYDVLMFDTDGREEGEARAVNWLLQGRADGVVGTFFHLRIPQLSALGGQGVRSPAREPAEGGHRFADRQRLHRQRRSLRSHDAISDRARHRRISMILTEVGPSRQRALGYAAVMRAAGLGPMWSPTAAIRRNPACVP